ncbi:type II secretion system protein GspG [Zooshikella ganghwensis]|uniref:type II secretion system protein GspG n=1 Tax=Zooshikella ganghwensis TaxID=202772 RepID=UPI0003F6D20B|nr:type II secretion system protein GspG [Zooshikella ganghwensis]
MLAKKIVSLTVILTFNTMKGYGHVTQEQETLKTLESISLALELFKLDLGYYPCTEDSGLIHLTINKTKSKSWQGPYLPKQYTDAWGNNFQYKFYCKQKNKIFLLYSIGKNKVDDSGNGDDIVIPPWK